MGYRQYLYQVDKRFVEQIRACKTNEEYGEVFKAHVAGYEEEEDYFPVYNLGKTLFEFGKYYENSGEMYKHGDSLFASEELNERYEDYGAIVLDKEGVLCAIEWQAEHIKSIYEDLMREKSTDRFDDRSQFDRLLDHVSGHLRWWKFGACNLDANKDNVADSWLYEHTIFDLVRIYKTFDWDNCCMIFAGW
jgi:hypothetical protein